MTDTDDTAHLQAELTDARERAGRYARDANLADDRCDRLEALANRHYVRAEAAEAELTAERARVERVRALADEVEGSGRRYGYAVAHDLRAALDA